VASRVVLSSIELVIMKLAFIVGRTLLLTHVSSFANRVCIQKVYFHFSVGFILVPDV
jgi:hypothetical protein